MGIHEIGTASKSSRAYRGNGMVVDTLGFSNAEYKGTGNVGREVSSLVMNENPSKEAHV